MKSKVLFSTLLTLFLLCGCEGSIFDSTPQPKANVSSLLKWNSDVLTKSTNKLFNEQNLIIEWNEIKEFQLSSEISANKLKSTSSSSVNDPAIAKDAWGNPELFTGINGSEYYKVPVKIRLDNKKVLDDVRYMYYVKANDSYQVFMVQYLYAKSNDKNEGTCKLIFFDQQKTNAYNVIELKNNKIIDIKFSDGFLQSNLDHGSPNTKSASFTCEDRYVVGIQDCIAPLLFDEESCQCDYPEKVPEGSGSSYYVYSDSSKGPIESTNDTPYSVLYTNYELTWYGMNINIKSEDVESIVAGTTAAAYILTKVKTGDPKIDGILEATETITALAGIFIGLYNKGRGMTIVCPLYVPVYVIVY